MKYNRSASYKLSTYLTYSPGRKGVDFDIIQAFVDAGANPLVERDRDHCNLFEIASINDWSDDAWLRLIKICSSGKVDSDLFSFGLEEYIEYQGPGYSSINLDIVQAFVDAGADPLVRRAGDYYDLFDIASENNWSKNNYKRLVEIYNSYQYKYEGPRRSLWSPKTLADYTKDLTQSIEEVNKLAKKFSTIDSDTAKTLATFYQELSLRNNGFQDLIKTNPSRKKIHEYQKTIYDLISDQKVMDKMKEHRNLWKPVVANILIALTGIGLLYISGKLLLSDGLPFFKTRREQAFEDIKEKTDKLDYKK